MVKVIYEAGVSCAHWQSQAAFQVHVSNITQTMVDLHEIRYVEYVNKHQESIGDLYVT